MSPRDLFGVIVRTAGLLFCLYGLSGAAAIAWRVLVLMIAAQPARYRPVTLFLDVSDDIGWLLLGFLLLARAEGIARFAYRGRRAGACEQCGYDLRGSRGRCPECGVEPPATPSV